MIVINEYLGLIASLIGSLTVVGGGLIWTYNTLIAKPRDRWRAREDERRQAQMIQYITQENKPLIESIEQLKQWLDDSKDDRKRLNAIAKQNTSSMNAHKKILDDHDDRLIILETKQGLRYNKKRGD